MSTYLISHVRMRDGITNQEGLTQLKRTVELHGGKWYSCDEDQGAEGGREQSGVLVEFANMTEAENWYNSSDYMYVSRIYVDSSIDLALMDGISPDFTMAGFAQRRSLSAGLVMLPVHGDAASPTAGRHFVNAKLVE